MSYVQPIRRELDIGAVFADAGKGISADWPGLVLFAAALLFIPNLAIIWWSFQLDAATAADVIGIAGGLSTFFLGSLFQVIAFHVGRDRLDGGRMKFARALKPGIARYLPYLAISIAQGLGVLLGLVLVIAPGVYLALVWAVVGPVIVLEPGRLDAAFGRSAELTRGSRWRILGLIVLAIIVVGVVALLGGMAARVMLSVSIDGLAAALVQTTIDGITTVLSTFVVVALYHGLVQIKEGGSRSRVAEVFA